MTSALRDMNARLTAQHGVACIRLGSVGAVLLVLNRAEHIIVRFVDGQPTAVFLSQHGRGEAYTFDAMMKEGPRPVAFSALGTHAMRAVPGKHVIYSQYVYDFTDYGPRWDMARNHLAFHYAEPHGKPLFEAAEGTDYPTAWLHSVRRALRGLADPQYVRWGNQRLPAKDPRQRSAVKFVKSAVAGPMFAEAAGGPMARTARSTSSLWRARSSRIDQMPSRLARCLRRFQADRDA